MFDPKDIIENIADNVRSTRNPFGLSKDGFNTWWKDVNIPEKGDTLLFTGLMYQLVPYIKAATTYLEKYEDKPVAKYLKYGKFVPKFIANMGLQKIASPAEKQKTATTLANIVKILKSSNVSFCYDHDLDEYSGVLLYDLGDQEGFESHAHFVAKKLQDAGIKRLITVDPHTTYALKVLYPKITGISFEVQTWFEVANLAGKVEQTEITLHDPCFYGRYLEVSDAPRAILSKAGVSCAEINNNGNFTNCCGGPAESVSPKLADEVGLRRVAELQATGKPIVALCPICMVNLEKCGAEVVDLSSILVDAV